jgi:hypothetical protein
MTPRTTLTQELWRNTVDAVLMLAAVWAAAAFIALVTP